MKEKRKSSDGPAHCSRCKSGLGWTKFQYNCGNCGEPFCNDHLPFQDIVQRQSGAQLERVCDECHALLQEEAHKKRVAWRLARIEAYFSSSLIPMTEEFVFFFFFSWAVVSGFFIFVHSLKIPFFQTRR